MLRGIGSSSIIITDFIFTDTILNYSVFMTYYNNKNNYEYTMCFNVSLKYVFIHHILPV